MEATPDQKSLHIRKHDGSSDILAHVFNFFPDPVLVWTSEGVLIHANSAAEDLLGYTREELSREFCDGAFNLFGSEIWRHPTDVPGEDVKKRRITAEISLRGKHGESVLSEVRSHLIRIGDKTYWYAVIRDFASLKESCDTFHREMAAGFEGFIPEMIEEPELEFDLNNEGFFTTANKLAPERTGYSISEIVHGMHFCDILPPEDRTRGMADLERALRDDRIEALEYSVLRKDGTLFPAMLSLRRTCIEGRNCSIHGIALDITEHKRIEHNLMIREKMNALGEMTGGVVHNFNNILSVILGYLDILPFEKTGPQWKKILKGIRQAALDGTEIVKRIQNFSLMQDAREIESADLNMIIRDVLEHLRPRFTSSDPHIALTANLEKIPTVSAVPFEIREVLSNIIINALEAMPEGGSLAIRTFLRNRMATVTVADTGMGMSDETKSRLFEPFFTTKNGHGTGIGMSVSYAIITKLGGDIRVESAEGSGTTVTIMLPPLKEQPEENKATTVSASPGKAKSILVLDDEKNICEILKEFLSREGHEVVAVHRGETGLELFATKGFDILITDLNMPGISGLDIARRVRKQSPGTFIIILTGDGVQIEHRNRREYIVDRVIYKPIDFSLLSRIIAAAGER